MRKNSVTKKTGSWDFGDEVEPRIHRIHAYPAKFPAFITSKAIAAARRKGVNVRKVVDIFCGCGTTALEACRAGVEFWGCDINPVATLIANVKSNSYDVEALQKYRELILKKFNGENPSMVSIDDLPERLKYWFHLDDELTLKVLLDAIRSSVAEGKYRDFFLCAFSNILKPVSKWLTKSIKPQIDPVKPRVDVRTVFVKQVDFMVKAVQETPIPKTAKREIENANLLDLKVDRSFADVIVTSPPYVTSYEYADLHQLSSLWLGYTDDYRKLRQGTIGSMFHKEDLSQRKIPVINAVGERMVKRLEKVDRSKARASRRYFVDMQKAVVKCKRILRRKGMVFFVIGDTEYKGVKVKNSEYLAQCMRDLGFSGVRKVKRNITGKILTPYRNENGRFSQEASASKKIYAEEYVLMGRVA